MNTIETRYQELLVSPSDIYQHLPVLRALVMPTDTVVEFGTRYALSTTAFLAAQPRRLYCYDMVKSDEVDLLSKLAGDTEFHFIQANDLEIDIPETDVLFIDTIHNAPQLRQELALHARRVRRYIILHDTETFGTRGQRGQPGLWYAIYELLQTGRWFIAAHYSNCHGLTVLQRTKMRKLGRDFVQLCAQILPIAEPVLEFGALQVWNKPDFEDLRGFFPDKEYIGADLRPGPGVDKILDMQCVALPTASVGTVLTVDTLEHVERPWEAVAEARRILRADGVLLILTVLNFPLHGYPHDYWRFTPDGFASLLRGFQTCIIKTVGSIQFPHTIAAVATKNALDRARETELYSALEQWAS